MKFTKPFYIQNRFFYAVIGIMILFVVSFIVPFWFNIVKLLLLMLLAFTALDTLLLFVTKQGLKGQRILPEKFSNGDENPIHLRVRVNTFHSQ